MKNVITTLGLLLMCLMLNFSVQAQYNKKPAKKFSVSSSADATMFQLALIEGFGSSDLSTLRFSWFWNAGFDFNYKLSKNVTAFSGLAVKNMGYIQKNDTATSKVRTYNVGVPLGLKIGNPKSSHFIIGGGVDFPFNLKTKEWVNGRENKIKDNEWFSNRVNPVQPFATIGYRFKAPLKVKFNYYPTNFWNDDITSLNVNMMVLTLGFDMGRSGRKVREIRKKPSLKTN